MQAASEKRFDERLAELANLELAIPETAEHARRVASMSWRLALEVGLDNDECRELYEATRYHDIGKLRTPAAILDKKGRLTSLERDIMTQHADDGCDLLGPDAPALFLDVARNHHERFDGRGYNETPGAEISLAARIATIADVHDAISAERSYKPAMAEGATLMIMIDAKAGERPPERYAFDPDLLRSFVAMRLRNAAEDSELEITAAQRSALGAFVASDPSADYLKCIGVVPEVDDAPSLTGRIGDAFPQTPTPFRR